MDDEVRKLLSEVFGDSQEFIELLEKNGYIKKVFTESDGGRIVSVLCVTQYPLNLEVKILADYIFYCATAKDMRGRGFMSALIKKAVSELKNGKGNCAVLIPAENSLFDFYEKIGFKTAFFISEKEYFSSETPKKIKLLTKNEAIKFYPQYFEVYGKRPDTLYKSEELFSQSLDEFLFNPETSALLSDGENFAFVLIGKKIILREFTGKSETEEKLFAESAAACFNRPVTLQKPSINLNREKIPLGMIYPYNSFEVPNNLYMNNMLN